MLNISNYNETSRESCRGSSFSKVYLLLLTQSLVLLLRHTHRNVMSQPKYGQIINCDSTILIFVSQQCLSVFPVPLTNYDTASIWHC